jgi:hypothetical protein
MRKLSRFQFLIGLAALTTFAIPAANGIAAEKLKIAVLVPGLANDGAFNQAASKAPRSWPTKV